MKITIPELSLVVLIGPSGAGKSTFARRHFRPTEILSSDLCRGLVADDENDQSATKDAFEVLNLIAAKRLAGGRLTVIDATNVKPEDRRPLVDLARQYHFFAVAIVLNVPERECWERNQRRSDRSFGRYVIQAQCRQLARSLRHLKREGFRYIFKFDSPEELEEVVIERSPLWNNRKDEHGPFDIIGDVHGCYDELVALLAALGYVPFSSGRASEPVYRHPQGRKAVFLGDLVDRGPRILETYQLVRRMIEDGQALCVPGNHDVKLVRKLQGQRVQVAYGMEKTLAEIESLPAQRREQYVAGMIEFFRSLISHYVLDDGKLVVAHAGMKEEMQGRGSGKVRDFALYGETTGETDEFGLPVRHNWAADYRGRAMVVYGHTPVLEAEWLNRTINVDTGCVFGGKLTALRYPEREIVAVSAAQVYARPKRPFLEAEDAGPGPVRDGLLRIEDVSGKRVVRTRLRGNVTVREENAIAALEAMSRFAIDPGWLIYLPPTMSPSETSQRPDLLEHPSDAFRYYQKQGVDRVICEQKHMGSRAVVVVCKSVQAARDRFDVATEVPGACYTRTGRRFFDDPGLEAAFLERIRLSVDRASWWDRFDTAWICLDCELMPWSAKAQGLIKQQYAAIGSAAKASLGEAVALLEQAAEQNGEAAAVLSRYREREKLIAQYTAAYRNYCWPVETLDDLQLAPFHLLATEGKVHVDRDHAWHMETLAELCKFDEDLLLPTPWRTVVTDDPDSCEAGARWWQDLTGTGGEGMVVKPFEFVASGKRGLVQPAIKSRGREYLRIIYGPEYTMDQNLQRLRSRGLAKKRSLALREFALGIESLERFVKREPLYRVHECVFAVLALESEPVDPRL